MSPQEKYFGIDLSDEVVRGSIVTYNGEILPVAPRPAPPPAPAVGGGSTPLPTVSDDRANLLASIQGKGIHVLKKVSRRLCVVVGLILINLVH